MRNLCFILFLCCSLSVLAQANRNDNIRTEQHPTDTLSAVTPKSQMEIVSGIEMANASMTPMKYSPTKAGLYSAVLPGLGQYYNKKYWKIPIVWGAIDTCIGFIIYN